MCDIILDDNQGFRASSIAEFSKMLTLPLELTAVSLSFSASLCSTLATSGVSILGKNGKYCPIFYMGLASFLLRRSPGFTIVKRFSPF
jgi:hypothetical protein